MLNSYQIRSNVPKAHLQCSGGSVIAGPAFLDVSQTELDNVVSRFEVSSRNRSA